MSAQSARLNQIVSECYRRGDFTGAIDAFNNYQSSRCYRPIKMQVYDSHLQDYKLRFLPCGKCYHCYETKINSWVTRMYAHLEDYKHVYFITLTYRSITTINQVEQLLLDKLGNAIWIQDSNNYNNHLSYNPCLLQKSHYQNFIKRLRKNTGANLTYVIAGEYGSTYGRPHFHIVLFSMSPITKDDVRRAWSICLWRSNNGLWTYRRNQSKNGRSFDFPIGRFDFHDLVANGSLNTTAKIRVDGSYLNASNCFAYVCKYVCKKELGNISRVKLAFNNLFIPEIMCSSPVFGCSPLHISAAYYKNMFTEDVYKRIINFLTSQSYEENLFCPSERIAGKINESSFKKIFGYVTQVTNYPRKIL